MNDEELEVRIKQLLADLGDNPDAVAEELARLGIQGLPAEESDCPVFHYLREKHIPVKAVDSGIIDAKECVVVTPEPVAQFIVAFDDGDYPELSRAVPE